MNTPFFTPITPMFSVKSMGLQMDEKEQIMEKVFGSDVFKEFIRQWGDAMPPLGNGIQQHKK
jgi:hypothetical protein